MMLVLFSSHAANTYSHQGNGSYNQGTDFMNNIPPTLGKQAHYNIAC
jgi:hypothetical protein